MKKIFLFSVITTATAVAAVFAFNFLHETKKEGNPAAPFEHFAQMRSYPDAQFDVKAYEQVLQNAFLQNRSNNSTTAGNWQIEGPTNIGGRITCLAVSPTNSNVILVGTPGAGIYKTTNGGTTWAPVFDSKPFLYIGSIAFDPNNPNTIYAGTGDPDIPFTVFVGDGVYKSTDGGNNWTNMGLTSSKIITKIIVNPTNSNEVYVSAMGNPIVADNNRGIYKSSNGGTSWTQVLFINNQTGVSDMVMNPSNTNVVYAASYTCIRNGTVNIRYSNDARVYKTTNSGTNWNILTGGLPNYKVNRYSICMSAQNPNKLYVAVCDSLYQMKTVFKTTDAGTNFTDMGNTGIETNYGGFGWYFGAINVNPANDEEVYIAGIELFKSPDGGANWFINMQPWWSYDVHADIHAIEFIAPGVYYLGTDGGVYFTNDDGNTYADKDEIPNTQFYRVEYNPHQPSTYWGGAQDNGTCSGNISTLNNWNRNFGDDGFQMRFDPNDANIYYVETQNGNLYATVDGGASFNNNDNNIDPADRRNWDMPYVLNKFNANTQYTGTYRVYKNTGGPIDNWTPISNDLTDGIIFGSGFHNISAIDNSDINAQKIYVGTSDANVWVTTNDGTNWTNITGTLPNRYVTSIHASPNVANNVYVTHTGYKFNEYIPHIHKSTNNGATWTDISGNLPQAGINDVLVFPGNENTLFVATDIGVYVTYNAGVAWHRVGNNMPIISVWDLVYNPSNQRLIAGTYAKSLQTIDVNSLTTGITKIQTTISENVKVYPSIVSTGKFTVETNELSANTALNLFDVNGKKVRSIPTLTNEKTEVDMDDLANGLYFVEVKNAEGSVTKRIIKN
jgi:photosystem II stability/assembly factor-like uncharacterized protein